jgi:hypothetical protein
MKLREVSTQQKDHYWSALIQTSFHSTADLNLIWVEELIGTCQVSLPVFERFVAWVIATLVDISRDI